VDSQREMNRPLKVGLVTDVGKIDDGTFNQYAYEGMQRAVAEFGLETCYVETKHGGDFRQNVTRLVGEGCGLIITVGSMLGEVAERMAEEHPKVRFATVDYNPISPGDNVTGLVFAEDQAGFLAGALAGLMTKNNTVGVVAGVEIPPVIKFRRGFEKGVKHVNPRAEVLGGYIDSFTDPALGRAAAASQIKQGADVIFGAGGLTGSGGILGAAQQGIWVIGVDQDEYVTTFGRGKVEGAERVLASAVKRVDNAVYSVVRSAAEDDFESGTMLSDAANDGVGLAGFRAAAIPQVIRDRLIEIAAGLKTGTIKTGIGTQGEDLTLGVWDRIKAVQWSEITIPFLAIFTALLVGALLIWVTKIYEMSLLEPKPPFGEMATEGLSFVWKAYRGLFEGALGSPRALADTLVYTTPYILAGLSVALGFKCGLFNIGAEGQLYIGALCATVVGFTVKGLPIYAHLPLAILAGVLGGAIWGAIPGLLKAWTGAHEVINTIMMNYMAVKTVDYLVKKVIRDPEATLDRSPFVLESARYPLLTPQYSLHAGFIVAIAAIFFVYWFLYKTTWGFEIRTVGANPSAARYAGMSVARNFVLAMGVSGALAGLAGIGIVLGRPSEYSLKAAFSSGFGFDAIAVALLAKSNPIAIFPAAFLWGALRNGAGLMQVRAPGISIDLVSIVQGLVIMFIAADAIVRWIYRIRVRRQAEVIFTRGWGG